MVLQQVFLFQDDKNISEKKIDGWRWKHSQVKMTVKATKDVGISHLQIKQAKQRERSISSFQMVFDPFAYLYWATKEEDSNKIHAKTAASPFSSSRRMSTVSNASFRRHPALNHLSWWSSYNVYPFSYENLKQHSLIYFLLLCHHHNRIRESTLPVSQTNEIIVCFVACSK